MIRNFIFTLAILLTALGCQTSRVPTVTDSYTSPTLTTAMGPILAEALVVRRAANEPMPEDVQTPEYLVEVLNLIRLQYPDAFLVTADQEARFVAGEFDDVANERILLAIIRVLNRDEIYPRTFTGYLVEQYKAAGLTGVRLELAARLLTARLKAKNLTL